MNVSNPMGSTRRPAGARHPDVLAVAFVVALALATAARAEGPFTWSRVNIGGGGHNHGIVIQPDSGTIYARQDVSGLLRWEPKQGRWVQLLDWLRLDQYGGKGCAGLAIDPSAGDDPTRRDTVYAAIGGYPYALATSREASGVYRSTDRGDTWTKIWGGLVRKPEGFVFDQLSFASNTSDHPFGECLAVDPANPDVLYAGTVNAGLWRTMDARAARPTFTQIPSAPVGFPDDQYKPTGIRIVFIDPSGGTVGEGPRRRSKVVYLGMPGRDLDKRPPTWLGGVWRSEDGGATFARLGGPDAPEQAARIAAGPGGSIFVSGWDVEKGHGGGLFKWDPARHRWSILTGTAGKGFRGLATDAKDPLKLVAMGQDHHLWRSKDGGTTWMKDVWWSPYNAPHDHGVRFEAVNWTTPGFDVPGAAPCVALDPAKPGRAWFGDPFILAETEDIWAEDEVVFTPRLKGAETTVAFALCAPASAHPTLYYTCADVNGFMLDELDDMPRQQLRLTVFPDDRPAGDAACSDIRDAPSAPERHVVARGTLGGYYSPYARLYRSTDSGKSWQGFDAPPTTASDAPDWAKAGGPAKVAISATDPDRWVYVRPFAVPYVTTDGFSGRPPTWTKSRGVDQWANDINPYAVNLIRLAADAVDGLRFYLAYRGKDGKTCVWTSGDGGLTWELPAGAHLPAGSTVMLQSVAGEAGRGELWAGLDDQGLWRSRDAGTSYERVHPETIRHVAGFAFGPPAPGSSRPTLYVAGRVAAGGKDRDGVFLSRDGGASFVAMTDPASPLIGGLSVNDMRADPRRYGRVYIGTGGTGVLYSTPTP